MLTKPNESSSIDELMHNTELFLGAVNKFKEKMKEFAEEMAKAVEPAVKIINAYNEEHKNI